MKAQPPMDGWAVYIFVPPSPGTRTRLLPLARFSPIPPPEARKRMAVILHEDRRLFVQRIIIPNRMWSIRLRQGETTYYVLARATAQDDGQEV